MYDAIIIGSGPGGYTAAIRVAQLGGKACIIEKREIGGVCTNWGCIPTKALVENVHFIKRLKQARRFGIDIPEYSIDFNKVMQRKTRIIKASVLGITKLLQSYGVDVKKGTGQVISSNEVEVDGETITGKNIIIATGSEPFILPGVEIDGEIVMTSDQIFSMHELPQEMIIIGGGIIGMEFAMIMNSLGSKVTVIEMADSIVFNQDKEIIEELTRQATRSGITLLTSHKFLEIRKNTVKCHDLASGEEKLLTADKILFSIGRVARPDFEMCKRLGLEYHKKGIAVNDHMQTSVPNIYVIGDAIGSWQLAHVAAAQGEIAAENMMGKQAVFDGSVVPNCIFTVPEIASVGAREQDVNSPVIGLFPFAANGKARTMTDIEGFVKVVTDGEYLLGTHIIGPHASDLIEEAALAIKNKISLKAILDTIHPHPTLCEAFKGACEDALGQAIDLPKKGA